MAGLQSPTAEVKSHLLRGRPPVFFPRAKGLQGSDITFGDGIAVLSPREEVAGFTSGTGHTGVNRGMDRPGSSRKKGPAIRTWRWPALLGGRTVRTA